MKPETLAELWDLMNRREHKHSRQKDAHKEEAQIRAILSRHVEQPAETEEQAARRELGAWLVDHPGEGAPDIWADPHIDEQWWHCASPAAPRRLEGSGPTEAAAIRDALRLAKGTDNAD